MEKVKFTAGRVRGFSQPSTGQAFYWDTVTRGLGVRATSGAKVYIFQGRLNGKTIRVKIGDTATWAIDSNAPEAPGARQEARRLQSLIDKGIDPRVLKEERIHEQEAKRAESARRNTLFQDVWQEYISARQPHWSERHYEDHIKMTHPGGRKRKRHQGKTKAAPLAAWLPLKLSDITSKAVREWLSVEATQRATQARLAYALLQAFVNWCEDQPAYAGLCDLSAFSGRIKKDTLPKPKAKSDALQREQLEAWFAAVRRIYNPVISAYLQILLLTGARREELLGLRWDDVDFRWKSLTIKDKVEGSRVIPLTPYTEQLLSELPKRNNWVFSSPRSKTGRLQEPRKAHTQALDAAGIDHISIHGLRRSFGTLSEWVETPVGIVYQIQGHKPSATAEKHYRQRPLDLLRKWHVKIEAWILEQAGLNTTVTDPQNQ